MAIIRPFKALRPIKEFAEKVASRPYDVLSSEEARIEAKNNPYSFLHITKSEIDLPENTDPHSPVVYQKANENLENFIHNGILGQEDNPLFYIYQLVMPSRLPGGNDRSQTGLVCVSSIQDYFNDVIKKHEFTRPEKEQDRVDHIKATRAQTGNVFLAYNDVKELNELIGHWKHNQLPVYDFIADDGIRHTIWILNHPVVMASIMAQFEARVKNTYIADGHHRAASAARVSKEMPENKNAKYFLTTIFPASQLVIMDYNRVVKDLKGLSTKEFLKALEPDFIVEPIKESFSPTQIHQFGMYLDGQWFKLSVKEGTYSKDPVGVLDVTILSNNILNKILGITDQRTDKRIDFVGGIRGLNELEKRVNSGEMKVAFSLYPVSIQQLFDIADSGNTMPPKSTWFEPKLRDGLLTHLI
jgi:uncharacterized protein (DUF1015 family)